MHLSITNRNFFPLSESENKSQMLQPSHSNLWSQSQHVLAHKPPRASFKRKNFLYIYTVKESVVLLEITERILWLCLDEMPKLLADMFSYETLLQASYDDKEHRSLMRPLTHSIHCPQNDLILVP